MKSRLLLTAVAVGLALTAAAQPREVGGDISLLTQYESHGARYNDVNGRRITTPMLTYFKQNGWKSMRVRLFVDPSLASAEHKGQGVCQDLDYVKELGARIKAAGFTFMLDFHYSDSWADPVQQYTPDAWKSLNDAELTEQIYAYTRDCLEQLVAAGATPDYIQTGNEISYGMCWGPRGTSTSQLKRCVSGSDDNWERFANLLKSAGRACREVCPDAKIILHTERVAKPSIMLNFYQQMKNRGVDYDIQGLSYYPYYHGTLTTLETALQQLDRLYPDKEVMIVETGYYHAYQPSDVDYDLSATYPINGVGQQAFTADLIDQLHRHPRVTGLYRCFPEANEYGLNWSTQRVTDNWYNAGMWDNQTGRAMPVVETIRDFVPAVKGDVNDDGVVDAVDLNDIVKIILGEAQASDFDGSPDVNGDGDINGSDINVIVNIILGHE